MDGNRIPAVSDDRAHVEISKTNHVEENKLGNVNRNDDDPDHDDHQACTASREEAISWLAKAEESAIRETSTLLNSRVSICCLQNHSSLSNARVNENKKMQYILVSRGYVIEMSR